MARGSPFFHHWQSVMLLDALRTRPILHDLALSPLLGLDPDRLFWHHKRNAVL